MAQEFKVIIRTANAAFEDGPGMELARILRDIADRLEDVVSNASGQTRDYNGHRVGYWSLDTTTEEEN